MLSEQRERGSPFHLPPPTRASIHLILSDKAIGFLGLLPLEEDHVLQWREGQGLRRNPARHCEGKRQSKVGLGSKYLDSHSNLTTPLPVHLNYASPKPRFPHPWNGDDETPSLTRP